MKSSMNYKNVSICIATLLLGIIAGYFLRDIISASATTFNKKKYAEHHEGQTHFINPLLACDTADDVLSDPEISGIKSKIKPLVNSAIGKRLATNIGVYFRELNDGYWFSIGETEKFIPASLRKVPLMIALLKQAERDNKLLDRQVKLDLSRDYTLVQNFKPSQKTAIGTSYTVRDLIYRMIVYSDNNAMIALTKVVDKNEYGKVFGSLRMLSLPQLQNDDFLSVQTYSSFFRILYNASYLSREASDGALGVLASSEYKEGIVAGVPPTVNVAHKFGEQSDFPVGTMFLHDCGIVYYPTHPYLLCIMTKGSDFEPLRNIVADISRTIYSEVDQQHRNH